MLIEDLTVYLSKIPKTHNRKPTTENQRPTTHNNQNARRNSIIAMVIVVVLVSLFWNQIARMIPGSYHFEVCSAGLERVLKKPQDFQKFLGSPVTVKLYRPYNGAKEIPGVLRGYEDGRVIVEVGKETVTFEKSQVALVRLRVEF